MNETLQLVSQPMTPEPLALIGAVAVFCLMVAYFMFVGWMYGRPQGVKREIIARALNSLPLSDDPIVAKRHRQLLEDYREKPKE